MALTIQVSFPDSTVSPLEVERCRWTDAMSDLFELDLRVHTTDPAIDLPALLGERAIVDLPAEPFLPQVTGIVKRAKRHTPEPSGVTIYEISIAPRTWLLTRRRDCRIFQNRSVPDIVLSVLAGYGGMPAAAVHVQRAPAREYCVQYDETDHAFVSRLLAEEGISSCFDHRAQSLFTLVDHTPGLRSATGPTVPFDPSNLTPAGPAVLGIVACGEVEIARVTRRDYDFERPRGFLLEGRASARGAAAAEADLEDYAYEEGRFRTGTEGDVQGTRILEGSRAGVQMARMRTNFAVGAGQALTVTGAEAQGTWLVVRAAAELDGTAPHRTGSTYEIEAIPIAVPFRPRPIKRPRIFGIQSATVVGTTPAGTVDVDEHGRVTLLFPWDRRGHTAGHLTRRVRVAQAWAGQAYGVDTWPRVGDEVLVAFEEGNPDAPIVIGRLHNAVSVPSFKPSGEGNTVSSWKSQSFGPEGPVDGFNLILMDDAAGAERLALRAQLDFRCDTHRNSDTTVGNNQSLRVAGSQSTTVRGGQSTSVGGAASTTAGEISVKSKGLYVLHGGFVSLNGEGFLGLSAANGERLDLSGVKHHFGSPEIYLHGKNVVQVVTENFHVFAGTEVLLKVGGSSIRLTAGGIDIESSGDVKINGATVKLNC